MTLSYSLWLKRQVMLDVVTLALLYTLRVIAGAAAMSLVATFWILAFCTFIFLSLALLKRYTELWDAREQGKSDKTGGVVTAPPTLSCWLLWVDQRVICRFWCWRCTFVSQNIQDFIHRQKGCGWPARFYFTGLVAPG